MANDKMAKAIKEAYPDINWLRFEDIDRSLNFDLWYGTASEYFGEDKAEPLEHYEWKGYVQAETDIRELLEPLPDEMWWDGDCEQLTDKDPNDDEYNWLFTCQYCGELIRSVDRKLVNYETEEETCPEALDGHDENWNVESLWIGGEDWTKINLRKELMFDETFKQVF